MNIPEFIIISNMENVSIFVKKPCSEESKSLFSASVEYELVKLATKN